MKKVLVVDDSSMVRNFHINVLKMAGIAADGASDGMEALERALSENYDLIMCDINMPNMDGLTFTRKYREAGMSAPIIIVSTQEEYMHQKNSYQAGADIYVIKPVKPEELLAHINMLT